MSSLDETKRQHNQKQVMARATEQRAEQLGSIYQERILPKMQLIHKTLGQLCTQLNQSDGPVKASFFIEGFGRLENLVQSNYQLNVNSLIDIGEIDLEFECSAMGELGVYIEGQKNVDVFIELFKRNGLKYVGKVVKDDTNLVTGAKLALQRYVPVHFNFKADINNACIEVKISNFETLGETSMQFSPEAITEDFLKKLAEYIIRRNKGLFSLDLSEIERRRIRAKVMYEQQQREAELAAADKHALEKEPRKKGFFTRLMGK